MWNDRKSIVLSKICVLIFLILLVALAVTAPPITDRLISSSRSDLGGTKAYFMLTVYSGIIPAGILLVSLYRLLERMTRGQVFIAKNVSSLRRISWCCFTGAIICLISGLYYFPWALVGVAAAFMGLIVRVVRNAFARAVSLQDDADYTI
jgi:hypothetical protein